MTGSVLPSLRDHLVDRGGGQSRTDRGGELPRDRSGSAERQHSLNEDRERRHPHDHEDTGHPEGRAPHVLPKLGPVEHGPSLVRLTL